MKKKGHIAFGSLFLLPVIFDKRIKYFVTNDAYLIYINNIIYKFNEHLIVLNDLFIHPFIFQNFLKLFTLLFIYYIGIRLPDSDLLLQKIKGLNNENRYLYHRQVTHSLFLILFLMFYFNNNIFIFTFSIGVLTHLIADMLTGSIPIFLYGDYRKKLNFFVWRIGIDLCYILLKPKYKKGSTKIQIIINKIKTIIVNMFEKLYYIIIITVIILYILKLFNFLN